MLLASTRYWRPTSGADTRDFGYAKRKFGYGQAFSGICNELLAKVHDVGLDPLFDALLIDEAQDLPAPFFELAFLATKHPKRVVYAYDELQIWSEPQDAFPPGRSSWTPKEPSDEERAGPLALQEEELESSEDEECFRFAMRDPR